MKQISQQETKIKGRKMRTVLDSDGEEEEKETQNRWFRRRLESPKKVEQTIGAPAPTTPSTFISLQDCNCLSVKFNSN